MNRICLNCFSGTTSMKGNRYANWYKHNDGFICSKCYRKLIWSPTHQDEIKMYNRIHDSKNDPIRNPFNNLKRLKFKDKILFLKEKPRKGKCQKCGAKKGDPYINTNGKHTKVRTSIHHIEYHDDDPLKDTIELCMACHAREGLRSGQVKRSPINGRFS